MNLLIDVGNTAMKYAYCSAESISSVSEVVYQQQALSSQLMQAFFVAERPAAIYVANVAGGAVQRTIDEFFKNRWNLSLCYISSQASYQELTNAYQNPEELGIDRWCGMVAAWVCCRQAFCVVDCGSAVTIDVVDHSGVHRGGLILPGRAAMLGAVCATTQLDVRRGEAHRSKYVLGDDTRSCVLQGVDAAISAAVNQVVRKYATECQQLQLILTGGDGEGIAPLLVGNVVLKKNLVLEGLLVLANVIEIK